MAVWSILLAALWLNLFTVDAVGRLTQASSADPLHGQIDYSYDALGNLRTKSYTFGQYDGRHIRLDYAANNRLHWVHDKDLSGAYAWTKRRWLGADSRGNTAHYGNLHAVYDMTDQPVQMFGRGTGSNGSEWVNFGSQTHLYDGHKRRVQTVSAWGNGTVYNVRYNIFDAAGTLVQVYDATEDERTDYIPGPNGALARIKRKAGTDSVTFIHADHLGTARAGTSATGARLFEDFHTPFGESLLHPDATDDQGDYTGHIRDRQTGLSYMQARYQDPLIGRFLSTDPVTFLHTGIPSQFNRYAYANNDPINLFDPHGRNTVTKFVKQIIKHKGNVIEAAIDVGGEAVTVFAPSSTPLERLISAAELVSPVSVSDIKDAKKLLGPRRRSLAAEKVALTLALKTKL